MSGGGMKPGPTAAEHGTKHGLAGEETIRYAAIDGHATSDAARSEPVGKSAAAGRGANTAAAATEHANLDEEVGREEPLDEDLNWEDEPGEDPLGSSLGNNGWRTVGWLGGLTGVFGVWAAWDRYRSGLSWAEWRARWAERFEARAARVVDGAHARVEGWFPRADALLPTFEELEYPAHVPTLVLELEGVLMSFEHSRRRGWQVAKRPGADAFLRELMHYFELVVWSRSAFPVAQDVVAAWGFPVSGVLHKDQCVRSLGRPLKDLKRLGRDPRRVIVLDDPESLTVDARRNALTIPKWTAAAPDARDDRQLFVLKELLKDLAQNPGDLRPALERAQDPEARAQIYRRKIESAHTGQQRRRFARALFNKDSDRAVKAGL